MSLALHRPSHLVSRYRHFLRLKVCFCDFPDRHSPEILALTPREL